MISISGFSKFRNIRCENILNDCLNVSFASVKGENLEGNNKIQSFKFWRKFKWKISNINFQNSKLGIAVRWIEIRILSNYLLKNNEYDELAVLF